MGSSLFNIGTSALNAAQAGLLTTGHNISNAATPGFNRQQIVQSANTPMFTGAGFFGQGTNVSTVERAYSAFLTGQVLSADTRLAELNTYAAQLAQIDNMLADPSAGLSPALQDFFAGLADVAANPSSVPARQALLSSAQALTARFQSLHSRFEEMREGVDSQVSASVVNINSYSTQIAEINQRIILAQASGQHQPPNDLLDQRDQLLAQLNQEIRVSSYVQDDGSVNVFIGSGQPVVVGAQSYQLAAVADANDPSRITVAQVLADGSTVQLPETLLSGGNLGGLLAFRNEALDGAQNALGRVAIGLAEGFNAQHRLGQTLTGALGGDFFKPAAGTWYAANNPPNTGTAQLSVGITDASALTASDYRLSANGGGNYTLVRLSDNAVLVNNAALPASIDGFSISIASGAAAAGDSFLIQPTRNGARDFGVVLADVRDIAAAAPIRTAAAIANTGTGKIDAGSVTGTAGLPLPGTVTLTYNAGTNAFAVSTGGTFAYTAGQAVTLGSVTVTLSGTPADGDTFTIGPNTGGVSDNRNALLLNQLQDAKLLAGGTANLQSAYSQIVSQVGNKAREVQVTAAATESLLDQATASQQSLSGVNLDEEAANLLRYQQAYQAASKVMQIASKLFDEILAIGR